MALLLGLSALGCTPGGVGDPCTPEDEYQQYFSGFQVTETNVESRSFQCETRLCLVNHFQGRVSCRLGQTADVGAPFLDPPANTMPNPTWKPTCSIPGTAVDRTNPNSFDNIDVQVPPQLVGRQTDKAVYCSCRCDGPDKNARYCECPEGFQCQHLVDKLSIGSSGGQLAGSYCIRAGSAYNPTRDDPHGPDCSSTNNYKACGCDTSAKTWPDECGAKP